MELPTLAAFLASTSRVLVPASRLSFATNLVAHATAAGRPRWPLVWSHRRVVPSVMVITIWRPTHETRLLLAVWTMRLVRTLAGSGLLFMVLVYSRRGDCVNPYGSRTPRRILSSGIFRWLGFQVVGLSVTVMRMPAWSDGGRMMRGSVVRVWLP